jgi:2-polyprenyl-3-methyl-5-hydroxy-6-metoxy-1,4-benzoquinol methylase
MKIAHSFVHGQGDASAFTSVLKHLQEIYPDWQQDVFCTKDKASTFNGLVNNVFTDNKPSSRDYDRVINHNWYECWHTYPNSPSTKAVLCLKEVFKVQGNTSADNKNLDHNNVSDVCNWLIEEGFLPVILDWDYRSLLPNNKTIFCPDVRNPLWERAGTGDAEKIAALCKLAKAVVAIDSGPQKVAFSTNTPTIAVWVKHHPIHYCDNAPYAIHLIPSDHKEYIKGNKEEGLAFFERKYRYVLYPKGHVAIIIKKELANILGVNHDVMRDNKFVTSTAFDDLYYEQHKISGLDYLSYGKWQEKYGEWLVDALNLRNKTLLDVGCACGSTAAGIAKAGALVSGCDCNEHMIRLGREKWLNNTLKVCDVVNMHYWGDEVFDCVHSNSVFEHFKIDLVPFILKELWRVTKPGGVLFSVLDTIELYDRQKRDKNAGDKTHQCIMPIQWWYDHLNETGWELAPDLEDTLKEHPESYFNLYDWPTLVARKKYE